MPVPKVEKEYYAIFSVFAEFFLRFAPESNKQIDDYIEDVDFLKKFIQRGIDSYGSENLIIKPDCGFLPLKAFGEKEGYEIAIRKVKNMVIALKELEKL